MARDFTKDLANKLELGTNAVGPLLASASAISWRCLAYFDSLDTGLSKNCLLHFGIGSGSSAFLANIEDTGGFKLRAGGRSQSGDGFQSTLSTAIISTGAWTDLGVVLDIANDQIRLYVNGSLDTTTGVTFGAATYTHTTSTSFTDRIGCRGTAVPTADEQVDGRIAEMAVWTIDIGTTAFYSMNKRFSPLLVAPINKLAFYFPLLGNVSPETDIRNGLSGTISGTVAKADHPRIIYPKRRIINPTLTVAANSIVQSSHLQRLRRA